MTRKPDQSPSRDRVATWALIAFALPSMQNALVQGPSGSIVPTFYGTEFGLNLALVGTALFISRVIDAIVDPVIGHLSDATRSRFGRRKPWLVAGALISTVSIYFLYIPPQKPTFGYFLFWIVAAFVGWSVGEIPLSAWGAEITRDYKERTRVFTFRIVAAQLGGFAFLLVPMLPIFPTTAITVHTVRFVAYMALAIVPLSVAAAVIWGPKSVVYEETSRARLRDLPSLVRNNPPLWWYGAMFISSGLYGGMFGAGFFLYFNSYLGLSKEVTFIFIGMQVSAMLFMPIAMQIINRFGRSRSLAGSLAISLCFLALMLFLPHGRAALIPLSVLLLPIVLCDTVGNLAPVSMLGDIVDFDTLKTGKKRAASFTALFVFASKINSALGAALGFAIIGLTGYQAKLGPANTEASIIGLKAACIVIPLLVAMSAVYFAWNFPIDARRQAIIARRLEQRERRSGAAKSDDESALTTAEQVALSMEVQPLSPLPDRPV